ncbi:MAG TPA: YkvA family protein [Saliniramus sp.]|nr:YkvA family protein [Saliniramus sp.]
MRDEESVLRNSWRKARSLGRQLPFAEDVIAAYFCVTDDKTPRRVKLILLGALAYFVMPFDLVPDLLPLIGFTDDAAVITAALAAVASSITDEHRKKAHEVVKAGE